MYFFILFAELGLRFDSFFFYLAPDIQVLDPINLMNDQSYSIQIFHRLSEYNMKRSNGQSQQLLWLGIESWVPENQIERSIIAP